MSKRELDFSSRQLTEGCYRAVGLCLCMEAFQGRGQGFCTFSSWKSDMVRMMTPMQNQFVFDISSSLRLSRTHTSEYKDVDHA